MLQLSVPCSAKNERTFPKLGLMLAVQPCKCLGELTHAQTLCSWLTKVKLANTLKSDPATLKMSHRIPAGKGDGDGAQSHPLLPAAPRCKPTGQESKLDEKCQNCFQKTRCRRRRESNLAKRAWKGQKDNMLQDKMAKKGSELEGQGLLEAEHRPPPWLNSRSPLPHRARLMLTLCRNKPKELWALSRNLCGEGASPHFLQPGESPGPGLIP